MNLTYRKGNVIWAAAGGLLYAVMFVFGSQLEAEGNVAFGRVGTWLQIVAWACGIGAALYLVLSCEYRKKKEIPKRNRVWLCFLLCALILYLVWFVQALGVYPGYFAYDAPTQWEMYQEGAVTLHHPLLHTLILGFCLETGLRIFGAVNKGVFLYTLFQMLITDISFSYLFTYLYRKGVSKRFLALTFLWFAAAPTVVINVMSATKDSMFAAFLALLCVLTLEMLERPEVFFKKWYYLCGWALSAFLTVVMRNNAVYAAAPLLAALLWVNRKYWKRCLPLIGGVAALLVLWTGPVSGVLTVEGLETQEFLSVPMQQLVRVYRNEDLTEEEKSAIESLFPEAAINNYNPRISDMVKYFFNIEAYEENTEFYQKLWLQLGKRYPDVYLNSFLENNYGFWYPLATLTIDLFGNEAYMICRSYEPAEDHSAIPAIYEYYSQFEKGDFVVHDSATKWLFSPGTYFCIFFLVFLMSCCKRRKESIVWGFLLLLWLTFLLGPAVLVRYVSFLYYLLPVFAAFLFFMLRKD